MAPNVSLRAVREPDNIDCEALLGSIRRDVDTLPFPEDRAARLRHVLHSHGLVMLAYVESSDVPVDSPIVTTARAGG